MGYSIDARIKPNGRKNKSGLYSIYLRLTINRSPKYFNLERKIEEKYWSGKSNHWIKDNHPFANKINSYLSSRRTAMERFIIDYQFNNNALPRIQLVIDFWENYLGIESFNDFAQTYVDDVNNFNTENTRKKYRTFIKHINKFNSKISFNELNEYLFQDFAKWMAVELNLRGRTVEKYFDPFRKICAYAVKKQFIKKNPFDEKIDLGITMEDPIIDNYLSRNDRVKLLNYNVPENRTDLKRAQLHWAACFWIGCRYEDIRRLTWKSWKQYEDTFYIDTGRAKNSRRYMVPVTHPEALKIFNNQKGRDPELIFPDTISGQKHNKALKQLAELAKINTSLCADYARGTAISYWKELGFTPEEIATMCGHKDVKMQSYYYILTISDLTRKHEQITQASQG